jgi:AcrR family transcriptional regulator
MPIQVDHTKRKEYIVREALRLAQDVGYDRMTLQQVADATKLSRGTIYSYFDSCREVKIEVLVYAVANGYLDVIAQAMALKDPFLSEVPTTIKNKARMAL